jgi:hypothetical protein
MNIKVRLATITISLTLISGCVAYAPAPYAVYPPRFYGGFNVAPVVPMPVPMFHGGWGRRGWRHHH